jgi:hypothetical protein
MSDHDEISSQLQWTEDIDILLAKWCDESKCFEWMHMESYNLFDNKSRVLIISSNILTSVSGLINLIIGGISVQGFQTSWIFGTISIMISITNMLQEKLGYGTSAVEHKSYAISWGIIRRKIEEELAIPRSSRKQCSTFLKLVRDDINKVSLEGSTKIPEDIRVKCSIKFGGIANFEIPDICGKMEHTAIYVGELRRPMLPDMNNITPI